MRGKVWYTNISQIKKDNAFVDDDCCLSNAISKYSKATYSYWNINIIFLIVESKNNPKKLFSQKECAAIWSPTS